jgi:hypothetical protein
MSAHQEAAPYIQPLNMNGLRGRMLRLPAKNNKKREILFIYGHHSSLERWWGVIKEKSQNGPVTEPARRCLVGACPRCYSKISP